MPADGVLAALGNKTRIDFILLSQSHNGLHVRLKVTNWLDLAIIMSTHWQSMRSCKVTFLHLEIVNLFTGGIMRKAWPRMKPMPLFAMTHATTGHASHHTQLSRTSMLAKMLTPERALKSDPTASGRTRNPKALFPSCRVAGPKFCSGS